MEEPHEQGRRDRSQKGSRGEAREDAVLFPALRTILTAKQVAALGDRMEEDEHKVLGDEGFEHSVNKVMKIETQLGMYDLKQFTPRG
jgi:hypothetical protein